jgi:hypothetical protein
VTVLALAVDPFTQQLVQYEQKLKISPNNFTTIVKAHRFSQGTTLVSWEGLMAMTAMADYSVQAGILNALLQPYDALVQQTAFACPTGNCTWDTYESLAVCSTCTNLSSRVSSYTETSYLYSELVKRQLTADFKLENATTLQLTNGHYINNMDGAPYYMPIGHSSDLDRPIQSVFMTTFGTGNASRTNSFQNSNSLLWAMSFLKMQAPPNGTTASKGWPDVPVEAIECGLLYCVNQYTSSVRDGTLYEAEVPVPDATRNQDSWKLIDYSYQNLEGIFIDSQRTDSLEFNSSTSSWQRTDLMFGDGFNLSWEAVNSLSSQFQSQFTSPEQINASEHRNFTITPDYMPINGYYKNLLNSLNHDGMKFSPSVMQILYKSPDLNDTFRRIARGLSNAIRAGADNSTMQTGASGIMTTRYRIQWPWITLHIIVAVGAIAFLIATMIETSTARAPVWKSSALAMMSLSLTREIGDVLADAQSVKDMKGRAAQHFLQLCNDEAEPKVGQGGSDRTHAWDGRTQTSAGGIHALRA